MRTKDHLTLTAFLAPDGSIGFSQEEPEGSLFLVEGPADELHQAVRETAVIGRDDKTWFLPGLTPAPVYPKERNALRAYIIRLNRRLDSIIAEAKLKAPWMR